MAARKTHTKSKNGCDNCKKRRIKCDELGPPCANCRVRDLECSHSAPHTQTKKALRSTTRIAYRDHVRDDSASIAVVGSRNLELELFHRWSTDTYKSFCVGRNDDAVWQLTISQDALKYDFLLNAIFAITSAHTAITTASQHTNAYQIAALEYQNLAFKAFQSDDISLTPSNHQAMFAFSLINLGMALTSAQYTNTDNTRTSIVENIVTVFGLLQGVLSIFQTTRAYLANGPFSFFVGTAPGFRSDQVDKDTRDAIERLKRANDDGYVAICSRSSSSPHEAVSYHESNLKAICRLDQCLSMDFREGKFVCMRWLATLERGFLEAVIALEPVALLILMHWSILLHRMGKDKWWARSSGKLLVTELSIALVRQRPEWSHTISWVLQQVGLPSLSVT